MRVDFVDLRALIDSLIIEGDNGSDDSRFVWSGSGTAGLRPLRIFMSSVFDFDFENRDI